MKNEPSPVDDVDPDDEELPETPPEVISVLGFDPAAAEDDTEDAAANEAQQARNTLAATLRQDVAPLLARVPEWMDRAAAIAQISDPALKQTKTKALQEEIDLTMANALLDPESARTLAAAISAELFNGLTTPP